MNYIYEGMETPEERIRNLAQSVFSVMQMLHQTKDCTSPRIKEVLSLLPQINRHLEDIEEFYGSKNKK